MADRIVGARELKQVREIMVAPGAKKALRALGLNARQADFVTAYFDCGSGRVAYHRAYGEHRKRPHQSSWRLLHDPKIVAAIATLQGMPDATGADTAGKVPQGKTEPPVTNGTAPRWPWEEGYREPPRPEDASTGPAPPEPLEDHQGDPAPHVEVLPPDAPTQDLVEPDDPYYPATAEDFRLTRNTLLRRAEEFYALALKKQNFRPPDLEGYQFFN